MIIQAPRASAILYNLLISRKQAKPWLMPANICQIVPITFLKAQVPFEFVDISAATLHMDLDQAGMLIRSCRFGGLLYAHTYGDESTPDVFFKEVKSVDPGLILVDDRCLCKPSFAMDSAADLILFSTGYAKVVDLNYGGYTLADDRIEYKAVPLEFNHAAHDELEQAYKSAVQSQSRFVYRDTNWLQTDGDFPDWASYRQQVEVGVAASLAHRSALNEIYSSRLPQEIQLPDQYQTWRFNIRAKNKDRILQAIFDAQLFASSHYASLAGIMADGHAPVAEALAGEVINLFNDHHFTAEMAERACDTMLKAV